MKTPRSKIAPLLFSKVYPLYVQKAERKGRTTQEVDRVVCWLTGYDTDALARQIQNEVDFETFFAQAPRLHPNAHLVRGLICGVRIEDIEDDLVQNTRRLDKLIDELARGKPLEKILRTDPV